MRKYKLTLEYNGENFSGSQRQTKIDPNTQEPFRTVQGEIEKALEVYLKETIDSNFSSRTDAGVHAIGQVMDFETKQELPEAKQTVFNLNGILPEDIAVVKMEEVEPEFNSRFNAKSREYLYKIFIRRQRPVLRLDSLSWVKEPLDFDAMQEHCKKFLGEHDFAKYCIKPEEGKSTICNVYEAELIRESKICFKFRIKANRFLRGMVRAIVGELVNVGKGKSPEDQAPLAQAKGLTLMKVEY